MGTYIFVGIFLKAKNKVSFDEKECFLDGGVAE